MDGLLFRRKVILVLVIYCLHAGRTTSAFASFNTLKPLNQDVLRRNRIVLLHDNKETMCESNGDEESKARKSKSSSGNNNINSKNTTNSKKKYYWKKKKVASNRPNNKTRNNEEEAKAAKKKAHNKVSKAKAEKKEQVAKEVAELFSQNRKAEDSSKLLDNLNPFQAGQTLRRNIDAALTSLTKGIEGEQRKSIYYIDDTFLERTPSMDRLDQDDEFVPEVLVVGATGEVGRLIVKQMLREGRYRIRVLVRDLYSQTLNLLGTGVTYCQGDLLNVESLEYALTDVDKIVFCAGAPRPDEPDFQDKFEEYMKENLRNDVGSSSSSSSSGDGARLPVEKRKQRTEESNQEKTRSDMEWEQLESVLEVRARMAEQVDLIGMKNLIETYQRVRVEDYGISQAAKRPLFKFSRRTKDVDLFAITVDEDATAEKKNDNDYFREGSTVQQTSRKYGTGGGYDSYENNYDEDDDYDDYDGYDDYEGYGTDEQHHSEVGGGSVVGVVEERRDESVKAKCRWYRLEPKNAVFKGQVPKATSSGVGGEAAIMSTRLRARRDDGIDEGIDLTGAGFDGFVVNFCSDGGNYEVFIRTGAYEEDGIEYVCGFSTVKSRFLSVRLPFANFKPVRQRQQKKNNNSNVVDANNNSVDVLEFSGNDIRHIGFRFRSVSNTEISKFIKGDSIYFSLTLAFIKVYRSQPEPEFVYLSDARIPRVVKHKMVRHDIRKLATENEVEQGFRILDDTELKGLTEDKMGRSSEETYFKYRGEQALRNSGLSYAIVRVAGFNESPSSEASTIDLISTNEQVFFVSRAEAAQVCTSTLLDPNALNKSFYVSKKRSNALDEDISAKFAALPLDPTI